MHPVKFQIRKIFRRLCPQNYHLVRAPALPLFLLYKMTTVLCSVKLCYKFTTDNRVDIDIDALTSDLHMNHKNRGLSLEKDLVEQAGLVGRINGLAQLPKQAWPNSERVQLGKMIQAHA